MQPVLELKKEIQNRNIASGSTTEWYSITRRGDKHPSIMMQQLQCADQHGLYYHNQVSRTEAGLGMKHLEDSFGAAQEFCGHTQSAAIAPALRDPST
jgi:hypothetical protein